MFYIKMLIWQIITCLVTWQIVYAYPQEHHISVQQSQRLNIGTEITKPREELSNLYRYGHALSRLRRAVAELDYDEASDDMELAEINVFRPLFRYRAEVARQVKNPQQRQFG